MYNIMVVDDAVFMRNIIKKILVEYRYQVVCEASTGREAVSRYKQFKPNLVLMDITMPDLSGTEAVKEIISFDPKAVVVMCSAMGQKAMVIDAISKGAKGFIVKPFDKNMVINTVSSLIGLPPEDSAPISKPAETKETVSPKPQDNTENNEEDDRQMSSLERRLRHELKV